MRPYCFRATPSPIWTGNADPNGVGAGYVYSTISLFHALHPDMNVTFINRGISGNRVKDLQARWQEDALDLNPDVLSILIGINDTWRRFDANALRPRRRTKTATATF